MAQIHQAALMTQVFDALHELARWHRLQRLVVAQVPHDSRVFQAVVRVAATEFEYRIVDGVEAGEVAERKRGLLGQHRVLTILAWHELTERDEEIVS